MKTKLFFFLSIILIGTNIFAQTYVYNIKFLGRDYYTAESKYCENPLSTAYNYVVSIEGINDPLEVGSIYIMKVDGYGGRYYKIVSINSSVDPDPDDNLDEDDILSGPINFICSTEYKYHKLLFLGTSITEAITNYCTSSSLGSDKVNILIDNPLTVGNVYKIYSENEYRYYKVTYAESISDQDADFNIDGSSIGSPITFDCSDDDNDDIIDSIDNCPTYNPTQSDIDNDGIGDACDSDKDGDGISNSDDSCPDNVNSGNDSDGDGIDDVCDTVNNNNDTDGDGISNSDDSCPDNYNTGNDSDYDGIDDICDNTVTLPNLTIEKLIIKKNGNSIIFDSQTSTSIPTLSYSNFYEIILTVINNGQGGAEFSNFTTFFSYDNTFDEYYDYYLFEDISNNVLYPNQTIDLYGTINVWEGIGLATPLSNNNQYTLIMYIDFDPHQDETNESDNIYKFNFKYSTDSSAKPSKMSKTSNKSEEPYDLYIYTIYGKLIDKILVQDINEEVEVLKKLPEAIYILNSINGSKKIYMKK